MAVAVAAAIWLVLDVWRNKTLRAAKVDSISMSNGGESYAFFEQEDALRLSRDKIIGKQEDAWRI